MDKYNPEYVEKLVKELMRKASGIVLTRTILGLILGSILGIGLQSATGNNFSSIWPIVIAIIVFGVLGFFSGQAAALRIRAEAQLMLTQLEIEKNTRPLRNVGKKSAPQQS